MATYTDAEYVALPLRERVALVSDDVPPPTAEQIHVLAEEWAATHK